MNFRILGRANLTALLLVLLSATWCLSDELRAPTLAFNRTEYLFRYSKGGLYEFTPHGQQDLDRWNDMLSINVYPGAGHPNALAKIANLVWANYKKHGGVIVLTDSWPQTDGRPEEYLIVVVFAGPTSIEAAHARLMIIDNTVVSAIHSHRSYGRAAADDMIAWLERDGHGLKEKLMAWNGMPALEQLRRLNK